VFYSGFCLEGEEALFHEFLPQYGDFMSGFSYGAISAVREAVLDKEIKRLILLSPAYYAHTNEAFREAQIAAFEADAELYKLKLLKKSGLSVEDGVRYGKDSSLTELRELLYFDWRGAGLDTLKKRGVKIEVFIGEADRVVDPYASADFFEEFADVYRLKNKNHILR